MWERDKTTQYVLKGPNGYHISKANINTTVVYTLWNKDGYVAHGQDLEELKGKAVEK